MDFKGFNIYSIISIQIFKIAITQPYKTNNNLTLIGISYYNIIKKLRIANLR
jgi:hypothetical protein